jgi:tetratricopeptide (TPR) repeat protein
MATMKLAILQRLASVALMLAVAVVCAAGADAAGATPPGASGTSARAPRDVPKPDRPDPMARARDLYNQGHYEAAIDAATQARENPFTKDAALLILGRAGLERFRYTADPTDLTHARESLRAVDASMLSTRDRTDLLVGVGEALYFDEAYRPAADVFESMLDGDTNLSAVARDQVLDWWATATDRYVRNLPGTERADAYDHLIEHMEDELRRDSGSAAAAYWLAAASFARGRVERAWNAAISGWVRGLMTADRGAALRPDLDRLVREAIIPERVRRLPVAGTKEGEQATAGMLAEWELVKEKWSAK